MVLASTSGKTPSFAVLSKPLLGPEIQDNTPAREPKATQNAKTGNAQLIFTDFNIVERACIKPDSICSCEFGTTAAMAIEPKVNSAKTITAEISIAKGYCFFGFFISEACTACTSTPAKSRIIPARYDRLFRFVKSGNQRGVTVPFTTFATVVSAAVSSSNPSGFFIAIQTIPSTITIIPGKTVPITNPKLVTFERIFVPPKAIKVAIQ